jgi:hypothetical protein
VSHSGSQLHMEVGPLNSPHRPTHVLVRVGGAVRGGGAGVGGRDVRDVPDATGTSPLGLLTPIAECVCVCCMCVCVCVCVCVYVRMYLWVCG